ncbi:hypothetical protein GGU10DRAFT_382175 [Lentinula aff. detonsa]|uniref:Uncharacterized protein n=1 Tax=Lentinula aff. detonsa TaxID=2804958 RepID=A0AA38L270_9AGAR|nr:hypothetical protein GGU10DRAFT_382175 [Lentinula aff. detonsa]
MAKLLQISPIVSLHHCRTLNSLEIHAAWNIQLSGIRYMFFGLEEPSFIKLQGLIDGKWPDAKDGAKIIVRNPATNEEMGSASGMGLAETMEAIDAAAKAYPGDSSQLQITPFGT